MTSPVKLAILIIVIASTAHIGAAQEKPRTIDELNTAFNYKNVPVAIDSREYRGRQFSKGDRVRGNKDWLTNVALRFKNVSTKTIVYLYADLVIENQGRMPSTKKLAIPLSFGNPRAPFETTLDGGQPPPSIKRGDSIWLSVSQESMAYWQKYLVEYDAEDFDRVAVDIRYIHFDDGTGWTMGFETRQDSENPSKWRIINPNRPSQTSKIRKRFLSWLGSIFTRSSGLGGSLMLTAIEPTSSRLFLGLGKVRSAR